MKYKFTLINDSLHSTPCCCMNEPEIYMNLKWIKRQAKKCNISFNKAYSEVFTHEFLHILLYKEISYKAGDELDNICSHLLLIPFVDTPIIKYFDGGIVDRERL